MCQLIVKKHLVNLFGPSTSLRDHLTLTVTIGVLCIVVPASLINIWMGWSHLERTSLQQGGEVAKMLANQAQLALIYDSPDNASDFTRRALSFPGVVRVEITHSDGRALLVSPPYPANEVVAPIPTVTPGDGEALSMSEGPNGTWQFVAPVLANASTPATQFELEDPQPNLLGQVRVSQSKHLLVANMKQLLALQVAVLIVVAACMLLYVRRLVSRVTSPLSEMTTAMARIMKGGPWSSVRVSGPRDLQDMAAIFNELIATLVDREYALDQAMYRQGMLLNHLQEAREDQNRTIARDLHDSIGGNLTTLKLRLALLMEDIPAGDSLRQPLAALHTLSHDTLLLTKHITALLRPTMLDTLGLTAALQWLVEEFSRTTRVPCEMHLDATCTLTAERNIAVFRIAQEALTNISRHSNCTSAGVATCSDNEHLLLSIWDNGQGFDNAATKAAKHSFGLLSMRERVLYLGGDIQIASSPGSGVKLDIKVPLTAPELGTAERFHSSV